METPTQIHGKIRDHLQEQILLKVKTANTERHNKCAKAGDTFSSWLLLKEVEPNRLQVTLQTAGAHFSLLRR